ncbi:hypothetical protein JTE90_025725 [Oedothorax gibbosus]|uniref:RING-type domain-containing protein n=1 Tax=Oedothorax gibbosus TaxID=931172 RepID=A0AAV6U351_9ARAC|nr:hypothetical protein JTE90_025725 [Oedothorax gibbosus]
MNFSCPICLDLFVGNDICATPCGHVFHSKCILKWTDSSKACPECRKNLTRNNVIKLYFNTSHNDTLPTTNACLQNDLDSKDAELKGKDRELSLAKSKIKDLQEHSAKIEEMHQTMYQKYLAAESNLTSAKLQLQRIHKLETKVQQLTKENDRLESQVTQFSHIHTVLEGNQQEAEEVLREQGALLSKEVGGHVAKNMAALCSILKRELLSLKGKKEESKKREDELLYQLGIKNAKIKKLIETEVHLKQLLKTSSPSPRPVSCSSIGKKVFPCASKDSAVDGQWTPTNMANCRPSTLTKADENSDLTPISIPFTEKRKRLKQVVVNKGASPTLSNDNPFNIHFAKPVLSTFKRKMDHDEDSVTRVGYNGLGGHERVILAKARESITTKPYKKNPNVKKG